MPQTFHNESFQCWMICNYSNTHMAFYYFDGSPNVHFVSFLKTLIAFLILTLQLPQSCQGGFLDIFITNHCSVQFCKYPDIQMVSYHFDGFRQHFDDFPINTYFSVQLPQNFHGFLDIQFSYNNPQYSIQFSVPRLLCHKFDILYLLMTWAKS